MPGFEEALLLHSAGTGMDVALDYDLHVTGGTLKKTRMLEGAFNIAVGATQNG